MEPATLVDLFAVSAERHPERIALDVRDTALTYRQLDTAAARMAAVMARQLPHRPARIGLLSARSLTTYVGYLAALRLGAAVVPLNPSFPAGRLRAIADMTDLDLILVDEHAAARAGELAATESAEGTDGRELPPFVTCTDAEAARAGADGEDGVPSAPAVRVSPEDVAYILYTSGSTGRPRGVPIRHARVVPTLRWLVEYNAFTPESRVSQNVEISFDVAVFELFAAWASGGALVVPRPNDVVRPAPYVNAKRVTHWFCVPSVGGIAARTGALAPDSMPSLKAVMFGGERLLAEQAEQWAAAAPGARLWNLYGPTEVAIVCSGQDLGAKGALLAAGANGTLPIGEVPPHLEHVILDDGGEPAETGELCVRGVQRFDGYLDPADDVGRFVEWSPGRAAVVHDGTAPLTRDLWYRTGDRVGRENGALVHLGRLDHQVKLRGHRIELGEVDAALARHPAVRDAVAVVQEHESDAELVAYYTGETVPQSDLTAFLRARLPVYMIPRRFTHLQKLPLNANGKVDRTAFEAGPHSAVPAG
ncbi:amino acid adenylation domain-containing protein [Streptomyces alboniger]|uniref:Amino acid adenylation domain-containing protein n=3 Tax=Streptomyces alboniger TaxID=132473 RepID=A0A5J6HRN0_STRAD|nr:amino acid adenylation domain-containing protein [Streptomyces alboniger]QEV21842.1 amino acid adenylation domain-containing protein [Streptomyces alboniger]